MGLYEQRVRRLREHVLIGRGQPEQREETPDTGQTNTTESTNPHTEHTRAWYMHELDTKGIEYRQNDLLDTLKELYTE